MFFPTFKSFVFIYLLKVSYCTKTTEYSLSFPELNNFTSKFDSCHIHLINYKYVNLDTSITPISLSRIKSWKQKVGNNRFQYFRVLDNTNRTLGSLFKYQRANFRWFCTIHIFLLPQPNQVENLDFYPPFFNYWSKLEHNRRGMSNRNIYESRMDYCVLITESSDDKIYASWSLELEFGFKIVTGGYIHRTIIVLEYSKEYRFERELEISKIFLVCPFCKYEAFEFIETLKINLKSRESFTFQLEKLLMIRHPGNSMDLTDMSYNGELFKDLKFPTYDFFNYSPGESLDLVILGLLCPNQTYMRVFVPIRNVRKDGVTRELPWITLQVTGSKFMQVQSVSYSFLTCDGFKGLPNPTFLLFVSAFHYSIWLSLLFFALIIVVLLKGVFTLNDVKQNPSLIPFMAFLEQGVGGDSTRIASFSWLVGTWMLVCVILSNAYKGQNITDLTAPRKPLLFETFSDLLENNFTFYSKRRRVYQLDKKEFIYYPYPTATEWVTAVYKYIRDQFPAEDYEQIKSTDPKHSWNSPRFSGIRNEINGISNRTISVLWKEDMSPDPLLEEALNCNRTAIIDEEGKVDKYEAELKQLKPRKYIAKAKQSVLESKAGWSASSAKDPFLSRNVERLLQSGIVGFWQKYKQFLEILTKGSLKKIYEHALKNNEGESVIGDELLQDLGEAKPLSLLGNMRVVFYLFSFVIFCGIVTYFVEVLYGNCDKRRQKKKFRESLLVSNPINNKFIPVVRQFLN